MPKGFKMQSLSMRRADGALVLDSVCLAPVFHPDWSHCSATGQGRSASRHGHVTPFMAGASSAMPCLPPNLVEGVTVLRGRHRRADSGLHYIAKQRPWIVQSDARQWRSWVVDRQECARLGSSMQGGGDCQGDSWCNETVLRVRGVCQ